MLKHERLMQATRKDKQEGQQALRVIHLEEHFITALRMGEEKSFKVVFDHFYPTLVAYAVSLVDNREVARDIVQDTIVKLWQIRDKIKNGQHLNGFLFISVRNASYNYLRDTKLKSAKYPFYSEPEEKVDTIQKMETEVVFVETIMQLGQALKKIPLKYQQIIKLAFFEDLSVGEIAKRLELPYTTVSSQKIRAIRMLKKSIKQLP